ncbi:MAG: TetR/AcrR family transcriptional regulator [Thermoleophilia bacterium]
MATAPARTRWTADDRREAIVQAAIEEFAASGFAGATTAAIARRAGISQPYVFRFFPTKKDLALAALELATDRLLADWERAVPRDGEGVLGTLGRTYVETIPTRRTELMLRLRAHAESGDPDIAAALRAKFVRVYRYVTAALVREGHAQADAEAEAARFYARGLLIDAALTIGLESALEPSEWASICPCPDIARIEDLHGA